LTREELEHRVIDGVKRKENDASKDGFHFEIEKSKEKNLQKRNSKKN
jgi:hypothetical protein